MHARKGDIPVNNTRARQLVLCLILLGAVVTYSPFTKAQGRPVEKVDARTRSVIDQPGAPIRVGASYHNDTSPPLRDIPPAPYVGKQQREANANPKIPHTHVDQPDPVIQDTHLAAPGATMPAPILNFDGIPFPGVACNCAPPDTDGEVGATQYVQLVNIGLQVFNKSTGASVLGPVGLTTIWTGFGGVCETNGHGDPVVLYDQLANRWLISQFAGVSAMTDECIAVSTGADATGTWYRYGFHLGANFFDYPHLGVWPDAYYMSMNVFNAAGTAFLGPQPFAFDRAAMLAGTLATFVTPGITVGPNQETSLPADLDGSTLPGAGAPATFVEFPGGGVYNVWHFHADFVTPGNTTFTLFASPAAAGFTVLCGLTRACVPQSGVTAANYLDGIGDRLMFRLAYRNFGTHESVVGNFTVSANSVAGVRWFELRNVSAGPVTVFQESTYQPDTVWRWMGSAAMDAGGNIAVGYSASSASIFPQIRYAGRLVADPLSTLPQAEVTLFAGTGSQSGTGNRWGDYSAMSIDPVDDCTFWYTQEYYLTTGTFNWRTRIGNFKFPSCTSVPTPVVIANGSSITSESYPPPNNAIDPGEQVTVSFTVSNVGTASTSNLVGTLQNTGGVTGASAPQTYGAIASGGSVSRSFTFTASGACGGPLTATVHLQDGATDRGNLTYAFTLGVLTITTSFSETFDGVTAPALPAGWTTAASGGESPWVTSTTTPSSAPNAAFAPDPATSGITELVTPAIAVPAAGARLTFKNNYMTESVWDGMVLEISIDGGAFADITAGGNAFISGGYNATLASSNPLGARAAWSGSSGGYVTSSINLPAAALGHNVKLKWRMASDSSVSSTGVRIDSITLGSSAYVCASAPAYVPRGDFNGDGKSDILWRHATRGEVWEWPMDGAAKTGETHVRTVADTDWEIRGMGDQTGDGKADILWRNKTTGQIYLWPMDGTTVLSETFVATVDPAYDIVGTGDYNGDGKSDILWRHLTTGDVWIWLMNGATKVSGVYVDTVDPGYAVAGSGDLNGDTKADIVWHHGTRGDVWVWLMNGTTRTSQTYIGTVGDVGYEIVGVADHTGDGKADILWHHATRGEVWIWPMNGTTVVSESPVDTVPDTGYQIVGTGDYNGDGKADILWHHATRGEVWVWLMDGTTKVSQTLVGTVPEVGYEIVKVK